ncbi:MAG: hypothetical protein D3910_20550 [Candidatus Electrothrix sp. ATG2]|nr:hypothetical protein [Candidatus Electrothrix sp. ATG2]
MPVGMSNLSCFVDIAVIVSGCMVFLSGRSVISTVRCPEDGMELEESWDAFDWKELKPAEQMLWRLLGWNVASWQGHAEEPISEGLSWRELSREERDAAMQLGYEKRYWDRLLRRKKK